MRISAMGERVLNLFDSPFSYILGDSNRRLPYSMWSLYNWKQVHSVVVMLRFPNEFEP